MARVGPQRHRIKKKNMCLIFESRCSDFKGELVKFDSVAKYFETVVDRAPRASARPSCLVLGRCWNLVTSKKSHIPSFVSFAVSPSR